MAYIRNHRMIALAVLAASLMLLLPAAASARVIVGFGVGVPVYPGYWGPYPYGYPYGPYGYGPYGYYGRPMGEVKIKSREPNADIYINGSLAGQAHDLKHFYLRPGTYNVEQRIDGNVQKERIYVIANRTIKIEFGPAGYVAPPPEREREHENKEHEHDYK
jgi:hypothetical protein